MLLCSSCSIFNISQLCRRSSNKSTKQKMTMEMHKYINDDTYTIMLMLCWLVSVCPASPLISFLQDKCFVLIPLIFLWVLSLFMFMFMFIYSFIHSFACLFVCFLICLFLFYLFDKFLFFSFLLSVCGVSSSFDHYYLIISPTFHPLHWSRQQIPPEGERKRKEKEEEREGEGDDF